jgi:hypothetical protein
LEEKNGPPFFRVAETEVPGIYVYFFFMGAASGIYVISDFVTRSVKARAFKF